jgi:hypothetical protein
VPQERRVKGSLLVIAGVVLVLAVAVLLILVRSRRAPEDLSSRGAGSSAASSKATWPRASSSEGRTPRPSVSLRPSSTPSSAPSTASATVPPARVHAIAPPVIPSEIVNEPDPVKRAELMKMHKLATARVRVSMLRHRQSLLQRSLERARKDGSWSQAKIQQAEADLRQIVEGIGDAVRNLDRVRTEVGGDIDR